MFRRAALICLIALVPGWVAAQQTLNQADWTQGFMLKGNVLSFGGAYRALANSNAAILLNPAGIAQEMGRVSVSADYVRNGPTSSNVFSGSVVDSQALGSVALGFSYDRDNPSVAGSSASVQQFTLAAASKLGILNVGTSIKGYLSSANSPYLKSPDGVDMDFGLLVKPIPMWSLAVTWQNPIQGGKHEEFPSVLGFGTALTMEPHGSIAIDITNNFNTPASDGLNAYFGGEVQVAEGVSLRGGFGLDRVRNNNFYSVGSALKGPKVSLLFAFSQRLNPVNELYAANIELYF